MRGKKKEREIKNEIAFLSIERVHLNRELVAIRKSEKITKLQKGRMSEIFLATKEMDHSLADLYYDLREAQLKIYGE